MSIKPTLHHLHVKSIEVRKKVKKKPNEKWNFILKKKGELGHEEKGASIIDLVG